MKYKKLMSKRDKLLFSKIGIRIYYSYDFKSISFKRGYDLSKITTFNILIFIYRIIKKVDDEHRVKYINKVNKKINNFNT